MSLRNVQVVYRKEMLDSLRDRRTLISMVVMPVLVMPALILLMAFVTVKAVFKAREAIPTVMVLGGEDSPRLMEGLRALKTIELVPPRPDYTNLISEKRIRAAVRVPPGFDAALAAQQPVRIDIYFYEGEIKSSFAAENIEGYLRDLKDKTIRARLAARAVPAGLLEPFEFGQQNVAPPRKVAGNLLGGVLPYIVILLCLVGAMYPAMDLTAGEKERGTMETILCSPLARTDLVLGKFLTVLTTSLATALLALGSMTFTLLLVKKVVGQMKNADTSQLALVLDPASILIMFAMIVPVAIFFAAAQLAIALFAKSFKEAQSYLSPLMFVVIVPAMMSMTPGIELNLKLSLIPILNTSLVSKEIMTGTYHWGYITLIFLSSSLYAAGALTLAVKLFQREEVLFRV